MIVERNYDPMINQIHPSSKSISRMEQNYTVNNEYNYEVAMIEFQSDFKDYKPAI